jgi:redox-sensitive bicupin YhaK (pirin superfamily)
MKGIPMIHVRKSSDRGHFDHGWLDTYHTFSFSRYVDRRFMGFRALRVINEDRIQPGRGFGTHGHADMEILTIVLEGELAHRDSLGTGSTIRPGELQCMTAGSGITHSEFNPSPTDPVHLYQIWLLPEREGLAPSYDQREFPEDGRRDTLRLVASPDGREGSLSIRQDALLYLSTLDGGREVSYNVDLGRHAWVQVLRGDLELNGQMLSAGDGAAISEETSLSLRAGRPSDVLVFDLA